MFMAIMKTWHYTEKRVTHSKMSIVMVKPYMLPPIPFLVISPGHGQVHYWEKKLYHGKLGGCGSAT